MGSDMGIACEGSLRGATQSDAPTSERETVIRPMTTANDVEKAVRDRYSEAALSMEPQLCCPVDYDPRYLELIPDEIIERDYGCGDPSRYLAEGETVLDLGSGAGKICFIASQVVGEGGRVIGVDVNDEMLSLAKSHQAAVGDSIGWHNTEFRKGRIQDLALDLDALDAWLRDHPVLDSAGLQAMEAEMSRQREEDPLIQSDSVDVVVSNCVLNLVAEEEKRALFSEIFRVLRRGGRAVISDIVSDEPVPLHLKQDPELWSGCISGALTETGFLDAFADAGFHGIELLGRQSEPWRTVDGIEFRSVTVAAWKGKQGACFETMKAAIYKGPFLRVEDDDGHTYERGARTAICEKTFRILSSPPYEAHFEPVLPLEDVPVEDAAAYDCSRTGSRHPRETKGMEYTLTTDASGEVCAPGSDCC